MIPGYKIIDVDCCQVCKTCIIDFEDEHNCVAVGLEDATPVDPLGWCPKFKKASEK